VKASGVQQVKYGGRLPDPECGNVTDSAVDGVLRSTGLRARSRPGDERDLAGTASGHDSVSRARAVGLELSAKLSPVLHS
jgi:hypothetical protein